MDSDRFDRLTQWMGAGNRRQVLGSALGGAAVLLGVTRVPEVGAKRRVHSEGPCGNGSIKDNRCKRNGQCCTGVCDKGKGKQPYGRCRCKKAGQGCQEDRNCCATAGQPMTCQGNVCVTTDPTPPPPPPPTPVCGTGGACLVFGTSENMLGNITEGALTGVAAADAKCQRLATSADLDGTFMAFISDATTSPDTRFLTKSTGPYVLPDNDRTQVAADWDGLNLSGTEELDHRINLDEGGNALDSSVTTVWTASTGTGAPRLDAGTCNNWTDNTFGATGGAGSWGEINNNWVDNGNGGPPCGIARILYCFQQS